MQNKRLIFMMVGLVLLVGVAAFVAGRMLNGNISPLSLFGLGREGGMMSVSINVLPAEELPKTPPEIMGQFVERKDKTIVIQSLSLKGGAGMVVEKGGGREVQMIGGENDGPKVEVVVTNETIIYRETTEFGEHNPGKTQTIQQTVEESTLDELNSQSMITVWGRKNGDRIIAEVLFYSNPVMFKRPGAQ
jgi:hypothetical protein